MSDLFRALAGLSACCLAACGGGQQPVEGPGPSRPVAEPDAPPPPPASDRGGSTVIVLADVEISGPCEIEPPADWGEDRPPDYRVSPTVPEGELHWSGLRVRPRQAECPDRTAPPGVIRLLSERRERFEGCVTGASGAPAGSVRYQLTIGESGASAVSVLDADRDLESTGVASCLAEALGGSYPSPLAGTVRYEVSVELSP